LISVFEVQRNETNVDISQALSDIKEGKVKDIQVQNEKLILNYEDGSVKLAIKEPIESLADLLSKEGIEPSRVQYKVVDQTLSKSLADILMLLSCR